MKATGERLVPDEQRHELIAAEHLARYHYASRLASGRRALDAASGEGYGLDILRAGGAIEAVGVDLDTAAVEHARERYGLEVHVADVAELPFPDDRFDLVVSFETIEHVPDPARVVGEFRRVLADDGHLIVSTPNRDQYVVDNEFHTREFTTGEFDQLLAEMFPVRTRLFQHNWLASAVVSGQALLDSEAGQPLGVDLLGPLALEPGAELYSLLLCGPTLTHPEGVAVASQVHEAHRLEADRLNWQQRALSAEEIFHERLPEAERLAAAWEGRARRAERQVQEVVESSSWRLTKPLREARARLRRH